MEKLHYPARKLSPTMEPFDMLPSRGGGVATYTVCSEGDA